jgi:hydroxycarboxylate dehydrogenase B
MPNFRPDDLRQIGYTLFEAAGCAPVDARTVVDHLVESSLFGHDSHGALRLYEYIHQIKQGLFDPKGKPSIVAERPCTAVVDGGGGLGQIGGRFATDLAIAKARQHGVGVVSLRNTSHVGRIGAYPLQVAREGLIGLALVNAGDLGRQIAPYGGLDGTLSTNPMAFASPRRDADPIMVDMTTSVTAEGKLRVAQNRGQKLPPGWIIDHDGNPSIDPEDYFGDPPGAILPLGGVVGYKGYCLSVMVEIMGGALSGQGCSAGEHVMKSNGVTLTVYDIGHFSEPKDFFDQIEILVRHIYTSRIDPKIGEILLPGEPEFRTGRQRQESGIPVDDTNWERIGAAARLVGLDPGRWDGLPL